MNRSKLSSFVFWLAVAGILGIIAWKVKLPDLLFITVVFLAVVCALAAFVVGGDAFINSVIEYIRKIRQAWNAPALQLATVVSRMTPQQIAFLEKSQPFTIRGKFMGQELRWYLWTPGGDVSMEWVAEYLQACEVEYPSFVVQHGMGDNAERNYIQRFTDLMVQNGLAVKAVGNQPAKWLVPMSTVYEKLDFVE